MTAFHPLGVRLRRAARDEIADGRAPFHRLALVAVHGADGDLEEVVDYLLLRVARGADEVGVRGGLAEVGRAVEQGGGLGPRQDGLGPEGVVLIAREQAVGVHRKHAVQIALAHGGRVGKAELRALPGLEPEGGGDNLAGELAEHAI